jgi:hypothetical protein
MSSCEAVGNCAYRKSHLRPGVLIQRFSSMEKVREIHAEIGDREGSCQVGQRYLATSVPKQQRDVDCVFRLPATRRRAQHRDPGGGALSGDISSRGASVAARR